MADIPRTDQDRIFLSSTFRDFKDVRKKILFNFQELHINVEAMEFIEASAKPSIGGCLKKLDECNIYLGVIGYQYGSIYKDTGKSYTHLEYEHAVKLYHSKSLKDIWIFLPSSKFEQSNEYIDKDPEQIEKLEVLKKILKNNHTVEYYDSFEDLRTKIISRCYKTLYDVLSEPFASRVVPVGATRGGGIDEAPKLKFAYENEPLTLINDEKEKLELEINQVNKVLQAFGRDAIKAGTFTVKTVTLIGNHYYTKGDYQKAKEMYDLVLRSYPNDTRALNNKGSALRGEKDREEAYKLYKKASELDPDYTDSKVNMGGILSEMGRAPEALSVLEEVYEKEEPDYVLLLNLGLTHSKLGNNKKAHQFYEEAEKIAPKETQILLNIATLYQSENNFEKAIEYSKKILAIEQDHLGALITLGSSLMEDKKIFLGVFYLQKALTVNPQETIGLINLVVAYRKLHDFGIHRRWFADWVELYLNKVFEIDENDIAAIDHLGWVYLRCHDYNKALELFEKALQINSKYVPALLDKAETLVRLGDFEGALNCIETVLEADKPNADLAVLHNKYGLLKKLRREEDAKRVMEEMTKLMNK